MPGEKNRCSPAHQFLESTDNCARLKPQAGARSSVSVSVSERSRKSSFWHKEPDSSFFFYLKCHPVPGKPLHKQASEVTATLALSIMPFFHPFSAEAAYQQEGSNEVDSREEASLGNRKSRSSVPSLLHLFIIQ